MLHIAFYSLLVAVVSDVLLGVAVFVTNPKRSTNFCFLLLTLVIAAWLVTRHAAFVSDNAGEAALWIRVCSACSALVLPALALLRFSVVYPSESIFTITLRRNLIWVTATAAVVIICLSPAYLREVQFPQASFGAGGGIPRPIYGWGVFALLAHILISTGVLAWMSRRDQHRATVTGIRRIELQFVFLAYYTMLVATIATSFLFLPSQAPYVTPLSTIVFVVTIAYGITSHRILDVRSFLQRGLSYLVLFSYAAVIFALFWFVGERIFSLLRIDTEHGPALLAAFAVVLLATPGRGMLQRVAARIIPPRLNFEKAIMRVDEIIQSVSSLPLLLQQFSRAVAEVADTDFVAVMSLVGGRFVQSYPKSATGLSLAQDDPIIQHLVERSVGELASEDLERHLSDPYRRGLRERMRALRIDVVVSIRRRGELTGLLLLGPRRGGRIYGGPGLTALRVMADQLAVAIDNCRLYTEARHTAAYIQTLVEDLTVGVVAVDAAQRVTVFNREAERILQVTRHDAANVSDLPAPVSRYLAATIADHKPTRDQEVILHEETEGETHLLLNSLPFAAEEADALAGIEGQAPGAILVLNDRTALRRLEQQIRQNERLASIGTLAAGTAHEIKNPLVSLRVFTQLLPKRFDDPEFRASFHELVGGEISRIEHIVNQLLNYARPAKPELASLHLHETIESVLRFVQPQAAKHRVVLHNELDAENDCILGDDNMLRQVFLNLLLNAIQALADRGGNVTVRTRIERGFPGDVSEAAEPIIVAEVFDDGPGIPPEMLPHVFDPFFTTKDTGTGLGLSVSHSIVREHGGFIEATSDLGRGSCFRLRLQIAQGIAPQAELELVS